METNASTITTTAATPAPTKAPAKGTLLERLNELRGVLAAAVLPTGTPKPNLQLDEQHEQWTRSPGARSAAPRSCGTTRAPARWTASSAGPWCRTTMTRKKCASPRS